MREDFLFLKNSIRTVITLSGSGVKLFSVTPNKKKEDPDDFLMHLLILLGVYVSGANQRGCGL